MNIVIENEQLLTDRFGCWPSFHDAEVVRARFERKGADAPFMEVAIHVFKMTSDVDAKGHYVLKTHTLVTIRFCEIDLEEFNGWNHQNSLWSLVIESANPSALPGGEDNLIAVAFRTNYGCELKLTCKAVKVLAAEDWTKD